MEREFERDIAAVQALAVVPTILDTLCRLTGMGFAAVARVTDDRWITCAVQDMIAFGMEPGDELEIETTICNEIRSSGQGMVIDNVATDPNFALHHTPARYGFNSYISMPIIRPDGSFFGTLCAIDPKPAHVSRPEVQNTFRMFSDLIAMHLDSHEKLRNSQAELLDEQKTAQLREQFIAVLGHDLRNPLGSMVSGISFLAREPQTERAGRILPMMEKSAARMTALIDNVLDFARGRLGGGLTLDRRAVDIDALVQQVVAELVSANPERLIETDIDVPRSVDCDPHRIGQLVSNLVGNAISHGASVTPIRVVSTCDGDLLRISVANSGQPISEAARTKLFQPFERGAGGARAAGLGLGLYIASEIAKAHGGTLAVSSTPDETRFTFEMPVGN